MLQRLNSLFDEELLSGDGLWPRDRLEEMNRRFVAAIELAFAKGLESRAAAAATVGFRNGKAAAIEGAIEGAWNLLNSKKGEVTAVEVVAFVRERCPNIDQACVRAGLAERFRWHGVPW